MATITPRIAAAILTAMYEDWTDPWAGDPFSAADCAARTVQTRELAAAILAAPTGTRVGPMTKMQGSWSAQAEVAANAVALPGTPAWITALGGHAECTLTGDGHGARRDAWCRCNATPDRWVRYEAYSPAGQTAHGYVCADCRMITQAG